MLNNSNLELSRLRSTLSEFGVICCFRFDSCLNRAFAYYETKEVAEAASLGISKQIPSLSAQIAEATLLIDNLSLPYAFLLGISLLLLAKCETYLCRYTYTLIEEYVRTCVSDFGPVLGVDIDHDYGEVYVHMLTRYMILVF